MENLNDKIALHHGFSLIELMAVVAIVSILASISLSTLDTYVRKARQSEAKVNLGVVTALIESYVVDNGPSGFAGKLTNSNTASLTSCNLPFATNRIGFKVKNCQQVRYRYSSLLAVGSKYAAAAIENPDPKCIGKVMTKCNVNSPQWGAPPVAEVWMKSDTSGLEFTIDPGDLCAGIQQVWTANFLKTVPNCSQGDFNCSGGVDGADYTVWTDQLEDGLCVPVP